VTHYMLRLVNPWAAEDNFAGEWANDSAVWNEHKNLKRVCSRDVSHKFWIKVADGKTAADTAEFYQTFKMGTLVVDRIFPSSWSRSRVRAAFTKGPDGNVWHQGNELFKEGNSMGPPFQDDDVEGAWLKNPQFKLYVNEPRTLIFISVGQEDRRKQGTTLYAEPIGFCVVPLRTALEKGAKLTRQDFVNPQVRVPPCRLAALPPCLLASLPPCLPASLPPCLLASLLPCRLAALPPCLPASLPPASACACFRVSVRACVCVRACACACACACS
jgi:hypothetical protein